MPKEVSDTEIEEKIRRVSDAMAQEGMPLTEEIIDKLYRCFSGSSSIAKEREEILKRYKYVRYVPKGSRKNGR